MSFFHMFKLVLVSLIVSCVIDFCSQWQRQLWAKGLTPTPSIWPEPQSYWTSSGLSKSIADPKALHLKCTRIRYFQIKNSKIFWGGAKLHPHTLSSFSTSYLKMKVQLWLCTPAAKINPGHASLCMLYVTLNPPMSVNSKYTGMVRKVQFWKAYKQWD